MSNLIQNQVYSRYIYQMLMEFGKVSLPQAGTFALECYPSTFKDFRTRLQPPGSKLNFSKGIEDKYLFSSLLIESGLDKENAVMLENLAIQHYQDATARQIPFTLDTFGTLVNGVFLPENDQIFNKYAGLETLTIKPISSDQHTILHDEHYRSNFKNKTATDTVDGMRHFIFPIAIALITIFFIGLHFFKGDNLPNAERTAIDDQAEIVSNSEDSLAMADQQWYEENEPTGNDDTLKESPDASDKFPDEQPSKINQPTGKEPKPAVASVNTIPDECILIVGAFKRPENAQKMIKKISSKGYKPYITNHQGFQRVGITFDCKNNDPERLKTEIRKKWNKGAWYLHDTI